MGFGFLINVVLALTGRGRNDFARDLEKQGHPPAGEHQGYSSPQEVTSSDDEGDHLHSPSLMSHPLRQFATVDSTFSGLRTPLRPSRTLTWSSTTEPHRPTLVSRLSSFFFPSPQPGETARYTPYYRYSPIISGVVIPFSILLEIPGLTERWYIQTEANQTVDTKPNPVLLDVGLGISMACAVFANVCLILRFSEKWIKLTTLLCIFFLTSHDAINIACVTTFGVIHRVNDGFTYGQSFWMTLCSTIASTITNLSLIIDYIRTRNFAHSGSGLTRKQRSLVILVIILLMYIALGALINSVLLHLSYINGLYFTVVSIETIGFGDIVARDTGARVWVCIYNVFGVITLGIVISLCRDTVLEGLEIGYRKRLRQLRARRHEARRFRRWQTRWRRAIEWRLRQQGSPVWVSDNQRAEEQGVRFVGLGGSTAGAGQVSWLARFVHLRRPPPEDPTRRQTKHVVGHPFGKHLNISALSDEQLHAAALEAGVPLNTFVDFSPAHRVERDAREQPHPAGGIFAGDGWPAHAATPTDAQLGRMALMHTRMALAISGREIYAPTPSLEHREEVISSIIEDQDAQHEAAQEQREIRMANRHRRAKEQVGHRRGKFIAAPRWLRKYASGALSAQPYAKLKKEMADDERNANLVKLGIAWSVFFAFWFVGSAVFSATEGWTYGIAMYFCFICFLTTGYGDYAPATPAGRSIFVVWALFGVATMTILVAVVEDACSEKYRSAMHSQVFDRAVRKYRRNSADEAAEVPQAKYQLQRVGVDRMRNVDAIRKGEINIEPEEQSMANVQAQLEEAGQKAHKELEALPHEIIRQARTFQDYMQFFAKGGGHDDGEHDPNNVPRSLRQLLDEIVADENVDERVRQEILADDDAKHTLFILSIERALKKMIHSADNALQACAERDTIMAIQTEQRAKAPGGNKERVAKEAEHIGEDSAPADDVDESSSSSLPSSRTESNSSPARQACLRRLACPRARALPPPDLQTTTIALAEQ
ncbi:voltage-gated potassium channel [Daedalea quercina L-15889]|uniref:Voltage-gated potassium channel n=1 Tax=Daedalea quercina L-15889 TaxID=1314783 RepID=A0A165R7A9_9APHY|nr:voltage-gated potassium channel [Daedalea quercina L-15889]